MDKKSKIFFLILFFLIIGSVGVTYWRIMIKKDYIIEAQTDCDPETEICFVWECDPESSEEGEACTGEAENDIWYYKIVRKNAGNIPLCDPDKDENCQPLICEEGETGCEYIFCDDEKSVEQEARCNNPEEYLKNNPSEEDPVCEDGDVQCGIDNSEELPKSETVDDDAEALSTDTEISLPNEDAKCEGSEEECPVPIIEEDNIVPEME